MYRNESLFKNQHKTLLSLTQRTRIESVTDICPTPFSDVTRPVFESFALCPGPKSLTCDFSTQSSQVRVSGTRRRAGCLRRGTENTRVSFALVLRCRSLNDSNNIRPVHKISPQRSSPRIPSGSTGATHQHTVTVCHAPTCIRTKANISLQWN